MWFSDILKTRTGKDSAQIYVRKAIGKIVTVPGTMAFPLTPNSVRGSNYQKPVVVTMTGPSYESLYKWQNSVMKELRNNRGLADITSDYSKNKPEVQLVIDEKKANDLGLSIQAIGKSIETLFSGKSVTTLNEDGKEYPLYKLDISNKSHPFFTGKQNLVDTAGRIEKFNQKYNIKAKTSDS